MAKRVFFSSIRWEFVPCSISDLPDWYCGWTDTGYCQIVCCDGFFRLYAFFPVRDPIACTYFNKCFDSIQDAKAYFEKWYWD